MRTRFKLEEFGLKPAADGRVADKLDTTTILSILVAFNIPLFTEAFKNWSDLTVSTSYFFGALTLIFYMLYLTDYYEKVWTRWFSLPTDLGFFRVYSLVTGVIIIALMTVFPVIWFWYVTILISILTYKKYTTRWAYIEAFNIEYETVQQCTNNMDRAILALAENMSTNFLKYGVLLSLVASLLLSTVYHLDQGQQWSIQGVSFYGKPYFMLLSTAWSLVLVFFWYRKIRSGLSFIAREAERGNFEFFEEENR
ncbi:MAG: hypothetical protein EOP50_09840 [Sphingobacteriales bacterium]|nr:MAG: hypothetical protein EOP50_09840 [Sphingobacteriales bacterium]